MRTILVLDADGGQGGGVVRQLLAAGGWVVRTIAREPDGEAARTLRALGAEVLRGDPDDPAALRRALVDCDVVFGAEGVEAVGSALRAAAVATPEVPRPRLVLASRGQGVEALVAAIAAPARAASPR